MTQRINSVCRIKHNDDTKGLRVNLDVTTVMMNRYLEKWLTMSNVDPYSINGLMQKANSVYVRKMWQANTLNAWRKEKSNNQKLSKTLACNGGNR